MARHRKPERVRQRHFLKEWREHKNLTQEQLASRMGIDRSHLSKIERQKEQYTQDVMEQAADALGVAVADIMIRNPLDKAAPWSIEDQYAKADTETKRFVLSILKRSAKTGT